jgi:nucleotide-binding universal stress UspA family protein
MFNNILAPTDGSGPSSNALDLAIDLARTCGSQLSIVHVIHRDVSIGSLREVAERYEFLDQVEEDLSSPDVIVPVTTPAMGVPIVVVPDAILTKVGDLLLEKLAANVRSRGSNSVATGPQVRQGTAPIDFRESYDPPGRGPQPNSACAQGGDLRVVEGSARVIFLCLRRLATLIRKSVA